MPKMIVRIDNESQSIQYLCKKDKRLAKVISKVGPLTYSVGEIDSYSFLIHEIIEQMLSIKAGEKIYQRLVDLCDGDISVEAINSLSDEQIRSIGTSNAKVTYIRSLSEHVSMGKLDFEELRTIPKKDAMKKLTSVKGIGNWTAKMYLIFILDAQDILPYEDMTFINAYKWLYKTDDVSRQAIEKKCKKWKPYSSIAARYLYQALDLGMTKQEFHLYKD